MSLEVERLTTTLRFLAELQNCTSLLQSIPLVHSNWSHLQNHISSKMQKKSYCQKIDRVHIALILDVYMISSDCQQLPKPELSFSFKFILAVITWISGVSHTSFLCFFASESFLLQAFFTFQQFFGRLSLSPSLLHQATKLKLHPGILCFRQSLLKSHLDISLYYRAADAAYSAFVRQ